MKIDRLTKAVGAAMVLCVMSAAGIGASSASAETTCSGCRAWWYLGTLATPSQLRPGGAGRLTLVAENVGDGSATSPVVLRGRVPAGLTLTKVLEFQIHKAESPAFFAELFCSSSAREFVCEDPTIEPESPVRQYYGLEVVVGVDIASDATSGEEEVGISGGGGPSTTNHVPITISDASTPFGVEQYELRPESADGTLDTQAGSHPFQLTSVISLNSSANTNDPPALPKDLHFDLPPGLAGNPVPIPQCPLAQFTAVVDSSVSGLIENLCPNDTAIGVADVMIGSEAGETYDEQQLPIFNLVPEVGEPARFGFIDSHVPVYLDTAIRTGQDYGVTVNVDNITQVLAFKSSRLTFWGVPTDARHDQARGWECLEQTESHPCPNGGVTPAAPPFLTMPTACGKLWQTTVAADSWLAPESLTPPFQYTLKDDLGRPLGMDGCNQLPFTPEIKVTPDGQAGSTPTGLTVDEHIPQESARNPTGLAESAVKGLSVMLPEGVALNPAAADGLQACTASEIALQSAEVAACPEASKIATVKIKTPLLPEPLEGAAYLATQYANPFGSLVSVYVYAEAPIAGVRAKAAGEVVENPVTGQLTAHFEGDPLFQSDPRFAGDPEAQFLPELPVEDIELHFFGGDRAPLATPALCGSYRTTGSFTPWSGNATTESSSEFKVISGPNGSPCSSPLPFAPALTAGTTSIQAGGFSPFKMTMSREDGSQALQGVRLQMPAGMSGTLSTVKLCGEGQADAGTCGPESQIGETTISVGVGGDPFSVTGGKVYITGPYRGAPFGLSIVNPAKAGPFDLGKVVVRAKIEVDPRTAQLTITTDNEGPYRIPTILDGIPLEIRHVNVDINRPGFTFNATNCSPLAINGSLTSTEGAAFQLSVPYQVTNCAVLAFKPKLEASTSGKTSRARGASLHVKLTYPAGPYDANIARVKVELPKQLPSQLKTLQKACTVAVFEANPADCPAESIIGHATATTPVLPVPLSGPAYFVSHGGEAFPSLIVVLQGYGVTVDLVGSTNISRKGITSSTFKAVPDVPVGTFELTLPQGPYSALTANANLCKARLAMPTEFLGQNGASIKTSTKIAATGCSKVGRAGHKSKRGHKVGQVKGDEKHRRKR